MKSLILPQSVTAHILQACRWRRIKREQLPPAEQYPQVKQIAIVSSDYHIATGVLLFGAEAILRESDVEVVSNAAWHAPEGTLSTMFQAGALIELSGDVETAFEIYYDTYDIHELPPLHEGS